MSYKLATDMVRQAFIEQCGYSPELFDSWLEKVLAEERGRIIELLDGEHSEWTAQHQEDRSVFIDDCSACFAIDIIKGDAQ